MGSVKQDSGTQGFNTLFVTLPNRETFTARRLPVTLTALTLRATLELVAGVPSSLWDICYSDTQIGLEDVLNFGQNIRNCAVLRLMWRDGWGELCTAVITGDCCTVEELLVGNKADAEETLSDDSEQECALPVEQDADEKATVEGSESSSECSHVGRNHHHQQQQHRAFFALFIAAHRGNSELTELLIKRGKCALLLLNKQIN